MLAQFIDAAERAGVFVLRRGEIEEYLADGYKDLSKVISLIRPGPWEEWLSGAGGDEALTELLAIVRAILSSSVQDCRRVESKLCKKRTAVDPAVVPSVIRPSIAR